MGCAFPFDRNCGSLIPSTPEHTNLSSSPTSQPASSSRSNGTRFGGEGDSNYDDEYCPTWATSSWSKRKPVVRTKPTPRRTSPSPIPSSESEGSIATSSSHRRARPYTRPAAPRNFQSKDGAESTDGLPELRCPVPGCRTKPQRISDLRRHIESHNYWRVDLLRRCNGGCSSLRDGDFPQGATREGLIEAGAYMFDGRLMVGGCMRKFTRRDALKRHIDNPKIPCIGDMD